MWDIRLPPAQRAEPTETHRGERRRRTRGGELHSGGARLRETSRSFTSQSGETDLWSDGEPLQLGSTHPYVRTSPVCENIWRPHVNHPVIKKM